MSRPFLARVRQDSFHDGGQGARRAWRERGAAALEFVGVLPIVLLMGALAFQMGLVGWAMVSTGHAARDAARAKVLGHDPQVAARGALPGILRSEPELSSQVRSDSVEYTVVVEVPSLIGIPLGTVKRSAEMPWIK